MGDPPCQFRDGPTGPTNVSPDVVLQRERQPHSICIYIWYSVNANTLQLAAMESMQFGHALDKISREIKLADPSLGPV